ncbi:MAG: ATP-binding protein [bacterium]
MNIQKKIELLKKTDLFRFFEDETLRELCKNCTEVVLGPDEILCQEGTLDNRMYLILSGEMVVYKGIKKIAELCPGKFLGEMSLIESKPRSATVKALSDVLLMEINEYHFKKYLASESQALIAMVRTLSGRIRDDLDLMSNDMQKLNIFIHDMNNFLSLLDLGMVYLENLMDDFEDTQNEPRANKRLEKVKKAFKLFNGSKDGLKTLINQSLSQAKKSKIDYKRSKAGIIPLINETVQELSFHKNLKGKHIKIKTVNNIPPGYFNYLDIKRVLQNLIINAGYVTENNGSIEVRVKKNMENILVSIIDKGCGIPERIRPFLFKSPFTTKEDGNGLGLLSCKEIIENNHNGKFWYDSEVGKGTAFHFTIPIAQSLVSSE